MENKIPEPYVRTYELNVLAHLRLCKVGLEPYGRALAALQKNTDKMPYVTHTPTLLDGDLGQRVSMPMKIDSYSSLLFLINVSKKGGGN